MGAAPRIRTEDELAPVRRARWNGATLPEVAVMLGCKPDHARKLCARHGIVVSPEAKAAMCRENGMKAAKARPNRSDAGNAAMARTPTPKVQALPGVQPPTADATTAGRCRRGTS